MAHTLAHPVTYILAHTLAHIVAHTLAHFEAHTLTHILTHTLTHTIIPSQLPCSHSSPFPGLLTGPLNGSLPWPTPWPTPSLNPWFTSRPTLWLTTWLTPWPIAWPSAPVPQRLPRFATVSRLSVFRSQASRGCDLIVTFRCLCWGLHTLEQERNVQHLMQGCVVPNIVTAPDAGLWRSQQGVQHLMHDCVVNDREYSTWCRSVSYPTGSIAPDALLCCAGSTAPDAWLCRAWQGVQHLMKGYKYKENIIILNTTGFAIIMATTKVQCKN